MNTSVPKFETEYKVEMAEILKGMGMPRAFDADNAEFGDFGTSADGHIYINRVLHKTYSSVGEKGTRAGAATAVEMERLSASNQEETVNQVYLNRPFVYMIIDCENNIPLFIGAIMDRSK